MPLIQVRVNQRGQSYQWYKAKEPRQCKQGHTINQDETYVRFFSRDETTNPPKLTPLAIVCQQHLHRCEECASPMLDADDQRFCCESCGQRHFDKETIDAEEHAWGDE